MVPAYTSIDVYVMLLAFCGQMGEGVSDIWKFCDFPINVIPKNICVYCKITKCSYKIL